jgi:hypothetical protein
MGDILDPRGLSFQTITGAKYRKAILYKLASSGPPADDLPTDSQREQGFRKKQGNGFGPPAPAGQSVVRT